MTYREIAQDDIETRRLNANDEYVDVSSPPSPSQEHRDDRTQTPVAPAAISTASDIQHEPESAVVAPQSQVDGSQAPTALEIQPRPPAAQSDMETGTPENDSVAISTLANESVTTTSGSHE
ncbi:hypothetical protein H0H92_001558, partial [Tricholoma furcatifolium]